MDDPGLRSRLHPDIGAVVDALDVPDMDEEFMALVRSFDVSVPVSDAIEVDEHAVPGDPSLSARVYRPRGFARPAPCLFSIHGGGYVIGRASGDNALFNTLCPQLGIIGVSIEYRLAPETPYPGPLEDCYRGLQWTFANADALDVDPECVGIRGQSAGGGLAAALALLARDRADVAIAFQLLDCPMLDDRQITPSSRQDGLAMWSRESNTFGWRAYLGELYGADDVPATAAPSRALDLAGLPPAFVSVGALDGFVDEDVDYAMRLNRAGAATELHVYPGACHGYFVAEDCEITVQSERDVLGWLSRQIRR
jgi:acetyl esterase/lipase